MCQVIVHLSLHAFDLLPNRVGDVELAGPGGGVGFLQEIERGGNDEFAVATDLMRKIRPEHRAVLYVSVLLHDIAKGQLEDHSVAGARVARRLCPRLGFTPGETETVAWLVEHHLTMSSFAQSRDLSDRVNVTWANSGWPLSFSTTATTPS